MLKYFTPNRNKNAQTEAKELGNDKAEDQEPESPPESTNRELVEAEEKSAENLEPSKPPDSQDQKIDKSSDPKPDDPRAKDTVNLDQPKSHNPVLNEDDEKFLERVTSEDQRAAPIVQPTIILDDGQKLEGEETLKALKERSDVRESICRTEFTTPTNKEKSQKRSKVPDFPSQAEAEAATRTGTESEATLTKEEEDKSTNETKKAANYWAYVPSMPSMPNVSGMQFPNMSKSGVFQDRSRERMANTLQSAADAFKAGEGVPLNPDGTINQEEAAKQQAHDLSNVLSNLNLSAINNRVFSLSSESHELLEKFNIVLRDLINGGPTAYHDLETLLDERSKQLNTMWSELPPFVQTLVKSLPAKIGSSFGPELFAAAAEKPDTKMGVSTSSAASGSSDIKIPGEKRKTKKHSMPSVKNLVTEKGAVAQMLRSILNFLRTRFPAFMSGTNVLMSLAVFILLFVFWYCHKRGRETRLASSLENSTASLDADDDGTDVVDRDGAETKTEAEDEAENLAEEAQIDAAVAEAKQEAPTESDQQLQRVLQQQDPKEVDLPESPVDSRTGTEDVGVADSEKGQ